ncbi:hypothetical protein IWQ60_012100 [Tieghemiomyces parasiticus]|uniref:Uncharacterized protein n=1 Tax=Tieghemiomyces parasiticus TaxID=78921 RepID=A0A9W8DGQ2_9FUNG|nr:hypothetical protein IWQ60_012100 [Tieghemiomyces parasiticus]
MSPGTQIASRRRKALSPLILPTPHATHRSTSGQLFKPLPSTQPLSPIRLPELTAVAVIDSPDAASVASPLTLTRSPSPVVTVTTNVRIEPRTYPGQAEASSFIEPYLRVSTPISTAVPVRNVRRRSSTHHALIGALSSQASPRRPSKRSTPRTSRSQRRVLRRRSSASSLIYPSSDALPVVRAFHPVVEADPMRTPSPGPDSSSALSTSDGSSHPSPQRSDVLHSGKLNTPVSAEPQHANMSVDRAVTPEIPAPDTHALDSVQADLVALAGLARSISPLEPLPEVTLSRSPLLLDARLSTFEPISPPPPLSAFRTSFSPPTPSLTGDPLAHMRGRSLSLIEPPTPGPDRSDDGIDPSPVALGLLLDPPADLAGRLMTADPRAPDAARIAPIPPPRPTRLPRRSEDSLSAGESDRATPNAAARKNKPAIDAVDRASNDGLQRRSLARSRSKTFSSLPRPASPCQLNIPDNHFSSLWDDLHEELQRRSTCDLHPDAERSWADFLSEPSSATGSTQVGTTVSLAASGTMAIIPEANEEGSEVLPSTCLVALAKENTSQLGEALLAVTADTVPEIPTPPIPTKQSVTNRPSRTPVTAMGPRPCPTPVATAKLGEPVRRTSRSPDGKTTSSPEVMATPRSRKSSVFQALKSAFRPSGDSMSASISAPTPSPSATPLPSYRASMDESTLSRGQASLDGGTSLLSLFTDGRASTPSVTGWRRTSGAGSSPSPTSEHRLAGYRLGGPGLISTATSSPSPPGRRFGSPAPSAQTASPGLLRQRKTSSMWFGKVFGRSKTSYGGAEGVLDEEDDLFLASLPPRRQSIESTPSRAPSARALPSMVSPTPGPRQDRTPKARPTPPPRPSRSSVAAPLPRDQAQPSGGRQGILVAGTATSPTMRSSIDVGFLAAPHTSPLRGSGSSVELATRRLESPLGHAKSRSPRSSPHLSLLCM